MQRELITGGFTLTLPLMGVRDRVAVCQTLSKRSVRDNHSQPVDLALHSVICTLRPSRYFTLPTNEQQQKTSMTVITFIHKENKYKQMILKSKQIYM